MPTSVKAIYVDFECLKTRPPTPILLGVLDETETGTQFNQIILDPGLHSAAAAARHLRGDDPQHAAEALLSRAEANKCPVIGWSLFDREVLRSSGLSQELRLALGRRYVNALDKARPWKTKIHPAVEIRRASRFDLKNTLDRFAALADYGHAAALRSGTPARWIRRVQAAVRRAGHYRETSANAKEDWRTLLEYNRHDCHALRHVWLKANRELAVWQAYERTNYCFSPGSGRPICFRVGARSRRRDAFLERAGVSRWAFLTAWNPGSEPLPRGDNARRQTQLLAALEREGYTWLPGEGAGADGTWPPEESLFVLGISAGEARRLGRSFGQLAIVVGGKGGAGRLVRC